MSGNITTLPQFIEFAKKVNYGKYVPTDQDIRLFMAKNALDMPHLDSFMVECLAGSGYFESRITKDMTEMLNKKQYFILKTLHDTFKSIPFKKGRVYIIPHPFYMTVPDLNLGINPQIKIMGSVDL